MSTGLYETAVNVLKQNDLGDNTKPAPRLYPHQWLWDSCFIAIGLRHLDPERATREIISLTRGQWENGMLPHEIFSSGAAYHAGPDKWRSSDIPGSPKNLQTTCMTQPPLVTDATVRIGEMLSKTRRREFYKQVYPHLVKHHQWLYRERDPLHTGLVALIHPWECGIEDTPYWSRLMHGAAPLKVKTLRMAGRERLLDKYRPDLKHAPAEVRPSTTDFYTLYHLFDRVRHYDYDFAKIVKVKNIPVVQDVLFNAVLVRANRLLGDIAAELGETLPTDLQEAFAKAPHAFETLYHDRNYWSRNYRTGELIDSPTAGGLLGLYAGTIPQEHADNLAKMVTSKEFWPTYGVASVPTSSPAFSPRRFWQGPVWVNLNWLIAEGLSQYGHEKTATKLRLQTLKMVERNKGMHEYYSALDATPAGTDSFSWTAALVIDMLKRTESK